MSSENDCSSSSSSSFRCPKDCTPDEFRSIVQKFFNHYIYLAEINHTFDLSCIKTGQVEFRQYLKNLELQSVYFGYILEECEEFISMDRDLLFNTLTEYSKIRLAIHGFKITCTEKSSYEPSTWDRSSRMGVPRYGVVSPGITDFKLEHLLYRPCVYQDSECVKKLLRYVVPVKFVTSDLRHYTSEVMQYIRKDPMLGKAKFHYNFDRSGRSYPDRRKKLMLMTVHFVLQKRQKQRFSQNFIDNMKLLFEAIPDAWISVDEIRKSLLYKCVEDVDNDTDILLNDFCKSFQEEFPESVLPVQPRRLKHLCRCRIRRSLKLKRDLPLGVRRMSIPTPLQKYILLE